MQASEPVVATTTLHSSGSYELRYEQPADASAWSNASLSIRLFSSEGRLLVDSAPLLAPGPRTRINPARRAPAAGKPSTTCSGAASARARRTARRRWRASTNRPSTRSRRGSTSTQTGCRFSSRRRRSATRPVFRQGSSTRDPAPVPAARREHRFLEHVRGSGRRRGSDRRRHEARDCERGATRRPGRTGCGAPAPHPRAASRRTFGSYHRDFRAMTRFPRRPPVLNAVARDGSAARAPLARCSMPSRPSLAAAYRRRRIHRLRRLPVPRC